MTTSSDMHYRRAAPNRHQCACGAEMTDAHLRSLTRELDTPAELTEQQRPLPSELRAAALDALQALGADYLTAARAVSRVLHAVEAERTMISASATLNSAAAAGNSAAAAEISPTWEWLQRVGRA